MKGHNFFSIEIFLMMDKRFEMEQKRHRHKHMYMSLVSTISFYTWNMDIPDDVQWKNDYRLHDVVIAIRLLSKDISTEARNYHTKFYCTNTHTHKHIQKHPSSYGTHRLNQMNGTDKFNSKFLWSFAIANSARKVQ